MFPNVNPTQMKSLMKQMGVKQEDVSAERVIIENMEKRIVIEPAYVQKITMQGQESWQISGESREELRVQEITDSDIDLVVEKTGVGRGSAKKALEANRGDIAEAIVSLIDKI